MSKWDFGGTIRESNGNIFLNLDVPNFYANNKTFKSKIQTVINYDIIDNGTLLTFAAGGIGISLDYKILGGCNCVKSRKKIEPRKKAQYNDLKGKIVELNNLGYNISIPELNKCECIIPGILFIKYQMFFKYGDKIYSADGKVGIKMLKDTFEFHWDKSIPGTNRVIGSIPDQIFTCERIKGHDLRFSISEEDANKMLDIMAYNIYDKDCKYNSNLNYAMQERVMAAKTSYHKPDGTLIKEEFGMEEG